MTEAALPLIEVLAALREGAVRHGHEMAPAEWLNGILTSGCARCGAECGVYRRLIVQGHAKMVRGADKPCGPTR